MTGEALFRLMESMIEDEDTLPEVLAAAAIAMRIRGATASQLDTVTTLMRRDAVGPISEMPEEALEALRLATEERAERRRCAS